MGLNEKFFASATSQPIDPDLRLYLDAGDSNSYGGTGTTWTDLTAYNNDGTISGATWNAGGYFDFDGLNDKVTLPSTFFKTTKILSVAVWVKFDTISQNFIGIIENVVGNVGGWALDIPSSASKLPRLDFYNGSSYSIAQGTTALTTGQWHHLCGTISGEEMKLYVNGSLEDTTSYSVAISNTNQSVVIGGDGVSTNYLDGQISDVKLYDKALSAAEVAAQFAIKQFDIG